MDHDAAHKYVYMLAAVTADLLRLVAPGWAHELDMATLEDVSAEYLDDHGRRRFGDMAWRVRFRDGELADGRRPYLLALVEFQSTVDRGMVRRVREYAGLLLDRLARNDAMAREGGLPRVLPVVVYNGAERWTAIGEESHLAPLPSARAERDLALLQPQLYRLVDESAGSEQDWPADNLVSATVRLQRSASPGELQPRLLAEARRFPGPARRAFREALHVWAAALWADKMGGEAAFPSFDELERQEQEERNMATMLQARWDRYDADVHAKGVELGLAQGRELGHAQGLADGRARLRRQAALKFGAGAAERLADRLAGLASRADLDRVGDWIIECESGEELLSRLRSIPASV